MAVARSSDIIDLLLDELRTVGTQYCTTRLSAPWGLEMPACDIVSYHFVAEGRCLLDSENLQCWLDEGDLVVFPRGHAHRLRDAPGRATRSTRQLPKADVGRNSTVLTFGGGGTPTILLCGGSTFRPADHPLIRALPDVLVVRADETTADVAGIVPLLRAEAANPRIGSETLVTRLSDVLVTHAVRIWLDRSEQHWTTDERLAPALALMHEHPATSWTVAELADAAHLSRSAFAQRFTTAIGVAPIEYLTRLRMRLATEWITEHRMTPSQVAPRIGYDSLAAFSRAYKRVTGRTPGSVRSISGTPSHPAH
jgi:AraC-like DNA-binding protein